MTGPREELILSAGGGPSPFLDSLPQGVAQEQAGPEAGAETRAAEPLLRRGAPRSGRISTLEKRDIWGCALDSGCVSH